MTAKGRLAHKARSTSLTNVIKLTAIWGTAAVVSFLAIAFVYAQFFGRFQAVRNDTIYEGHYKIGQPGTTELYTREGYGRTSYGENGLVVDKPLDPQATRLLFLGDSFVQGRQVHDEEKFTELAELGWNESYPDQPIQALNLGLDGQNTADYVYFASNLDRTFHPDKVFVFVSKDDLVTTAEFEKKLKRLAGPARQPASAETIDLISDMGHYAFLKCMKRQITGFKQANRPIGFERFAAQDSPSSTSAPAEPSAQDVAVQLAQMKDAWGDRLVMIYFTFSPTPGHAAPTTCSDMYYQEMLKQNIPTIHLCRPLYDAVVAGNPPAGFNNSKLGSGHLNKNGHAIIAQEIIKFLETADGLF